MMECTAPNLLSNNLVCAPGALLAGRFYDQENNNKEKDKVV
jgi:hypothetical protein